MTRNEPGEKPAALGHAERLVYSHRSIAVRDGIELLRDNPNPTEQDIRIGISGNLCRCTGYHNIVAAALDAARRLREAT